MSKQKQILVAALGAPRHSSNELLFQCPNCNHHKKKLSINITKNVFKCWICDFSGKDISFLLRKHASDHLYSAWKKLVGNSTRISEAIEECIHQPALELPKEFISLIGAETNPRARKYYDYLFSRGVSMEDIKKWKIGFCDSGSYYHRVVVPSFNNSGGLSYFVARDIGDKFFKYKNPNFSKDIVFNDLMVDWTKPIVLVEGIFDAMRFDNSIPLLGSTLQSGSLLFKKICKKRPDIYLGLDRDASKKEETIIKNLLLHDIKVYKVPYPSNGDYGDLTKDACLKIKEKSHFVGGTDYLLYKKIFLEDF